MSQNVIRFLPALLVTSILITGCGSGGEEDSQSSATLSEFFVHTAGAQSKTFAIGQKEMQVRCRPNLGTKVFEFEAAPKFGASDGNFLRLNLIGFNGSGTYTFIYDAVKARSVVDLGVEGGFKYKFFQTVRADSAEQISSVCSLSITDQDVGTGTQYDGQLSCAMLLADEESADYQDMNVGVFVDMIANFQCEFSY